MRILVLGGAGAMGQRAVRTLAEYPEVKQITLAGRNLAKVQALADELGGAPRFQAVQVDASDHQALVATIRGHDVVASALGPFYQFEARVAKACIDADSDCVSICDDYDGAAAVLKLHDNAQQAGRRILTGFGWTPGLTNIAALLGSAHMDKPETVDMAWAAGASDSSGQAVLLHMFHALTGYVPSMQGGTMVEVKAGSSPLTVPFPAPIGHVKTYHVGHPEPVTMPHWIPGLKRVTLRGALTEPFANWVVLSLCRLGLVRSEKMRQLVAKVTLPLSPLITRIGPRRPPLAGLWVEVTGTKAGASVKVTYTAIGRMEDLTSVPLALGALLLGRGDIEPTGVLAPETPGVLQSSSFLKELAKHGINLQETITK